MATSTRQYRVITNGETADDSPITVSQVHEACDAINNMKRYSLRHKLLCMTGIAAIANTGSTSEKVIAMPAPIFVPDGYNYFFWSASHRYLTGSNSVTWRMYASNGLYTGPETFDSSYLTSGYTSDTFSSDSTWARETSARWEIPIYPDQMIWIVLTAQTVVDGTSSIATFDLYPSIV